jgi:hypothetical protein
MGVVIASSGRMRDATTTGPIRPRLDDPFRCVSRSPEAPLPPPEERWNTPAQ